MRLFLVFLSTRHLNSDHLIGASDSFQTAVLEAESITEGDIGGTKGREVLYTFLAQSQRLQGALEKAANNADHAIRLNSAYATGHLIRGSIYYDSALPTWDEGKLDLAQLEYELASDAKERASAIYLDTQVNVGLDNITVIRAQQQSNDEKLFAQALDYYSIVVQRYEANMDQRSKHLAAITYFGIGVIYEKLKKPTEAENAYQRSIDLSDDPVLKERAQGQLKIVQSQSFESSE